MAITVKHTKVSTIPDGDDTSVVRPSDWNADHQLTGTVPVANGGTGAATLTGYVKGNGTSTMTASSTIPNTDITGLGTASTKDAGVANGVATLDSAGKVPVSQIPALGDLNYQGTWNATTNTPTLTSSVGTKGYYYVVSVAGTTNLNGITDWQVGDWAVYNGTAWQKIDNTDAVTSVNGYTGTVVLTQSDISGTVPTSRTITAGTGLTGGGDLSANRTLAIATTGVSAATYGSASVVPVIAINTQGQITSATNTTIAIANTQVSGLGTMSTQNSNSVTITGGSLNGVAIGGTTAGDGTFDILTANVSRLGTSTATSYVASNGLSSTSTFSGTPPTDGIVVDYSTGYGRFSAFAGDGYQWYTGGIGATKIMDLSSSGALVTNGTVTANGVVLTGNTGTVTSVAATAGTGISVSGSPITTSGTLTITNTAPDQTVVLTAGTGISTSGTYPNFTITNTSPSSGGTVTSVAALTLGTTGTDLSSSVANGTTTPVITLNVPTASATNRGALSAADWTTFNSKAPGTTFTTNYVPYGQGTTTLNQSSSFTYDGTTLTAPKLAATASVSGSSTKGAISYGTLGYSDSNHLATFQTAANAYAQVEIQNTQAGTSASADMVVGNDLTTSSTYYGDFGINSSLFSGTGSLGLANAVYLTATTGDLAIGTTTSNAIHFVINGSATDAMSISTAGLVTIASTLRVGTGVTGGIAGGTF